MRILLVPMLFSIATVALGAEAPPEVSVQSGKGSAQATAQARIVRGYSTKALEGKAAEKPARTKARQVPCREGDAKVASAPCVMQVVDLE